ncbi:hypothetical protein [Nocardia aurantiaca]|uniref:Uncharacterized protein n=1 Tax=Nocardia aurantiaca TaxID=2675850 RepID=A0A6I3L0P5_9NOCA|nr:hypothetical protein [Nocardia aurantiaca]MTE14196.1 hypothetical protein [Nocardia aurantiaca]
MDYDTLCREIADVEQVGAKLSDLVRPAPPGNGRGAEILHSATVTS